jgi:hypothetical protein
VNAVKLSAISAAALLALAAPCCCFENPTQLPVAQIVSRSVEANTADWKAQPQYSHRERDVKNKVDGNGRVQGGESKTFEQFMLEGSPYSRLIEIDGKPLSRTQEQQEQIKLNAESERRAHESASERRARVAKYQAARAEEHLLMQQMAEAFRFSLAGEQNVNGVDCYVLDAQPNPAYNPPVEKARVLLGMKGRMWIDKEHYHWVKVQAQVINAVPFGVFVAKVKPGTRFELEQAPSGNVWLPKRFSESVNATIFGVYSMRNNEEELYSDYRSGFLPAAPSLSEIALR